MRFFNFNNNNNNRRSWRSVDLNKYQIHATIESTDKSEETSNEKVVDIEDSAKREKVYGICKECGEPGTGERWCRPCNSKRLEDNFKNWTSGNKEIDELIQHSQLTAVYSGKLLEWIPFEKFDSVTYISRGGFGKIYSARYYDGFIRYWDIGSKSWKRSSPEYVALKSLDNSVNISAEFINEIKSHLQIYIEEIIPCYGITQDPSTKDYMMILHYCKKGNLRDFLNGPKDLKVYRTKIPHLVKIIRGLRDIHLADKVHKDFHSGNILFGGSSPYIGDLGMCQPASIDGQSTKKDGIYGVLPYMAPEVLCGSQYTKAADVYSFGVIMNEFISEEIPYNDTSHDAILAVKVCKGHRPSISKDTPGLLTDLIKRCWSVKPEDRPSSTELCQILDKWKDEIHDKSTEIYSQMKEYGKARENTLKTCRSKSKSRSLQIHSQAIYTSRLLNFQSLLNPENSSELSSVDIPLKSNNPISECFDCQLDELDFVEEDKENTCNNNIE